MKPPPETRWPLVLLATAGGVLAALHVGKAPPALPTIRAELDLGLVAGGWIASSVAAIAALFGLAGGIVADRVGRRRLVLAGIGALILGGATGALADSALPLLAGRLLEGVGFVAIVVGAPSLIVEATAAPQQRLALGIWSAYMPAGMALVLAVAPPVIATIGWRGLWVCLAALAALFLVLFMRRMPDHFGRPPPQGLSPADLGAALARPGPWLLGGCFGCYTVQWVAVMTWLPTFIVEEAGRPLALAGPLGAFVVLMNVPGNLIGGFLLQRNVPRPILVCVALAVMSATTFGMFGSNLPETTRYLLAAVFSLVGGILPAAVLSGAPRHASTPAQVGAVNGIIVQGSNLGSVSGPPLLAASVALAGDWSGARDLLIAASLLGLAFGVLLWREERRR